MAVVCFGSVRAAPGATTLAVLTAAVWPGPAVLVEADPDGGVLALRYGLSRHPGLTDLAAILREAPSADALLRAAQALPGSDLPVVVAPESGSVATHVLADVAASLGTWCADIEGLDVVVDCGRLGPGSPAVPLLDSASDVLLVAHPRADELYAAAHRLADLRRAPGAGLVLVGEHPHTNAEVAGQFGLRVVGVVADDPRTAGLVQTGQGSMRVLRRSLLVRSVQSLVDELAARIGIGTPDAASRPADASGSRGSTPRSAARRRRSPAHAKAGGER
jgi:hypothetical protein